MIKEINKLLESLFDDDDDELFNDDNIGMTNDLLEDSLLIIQHTILLKEKFFLLINTKTTMNTHFTIMRIKIIIIVL